MIVSVSRRCDIPRYQFDWFMDRLDAGFVEVANPFNSRQIRRVSLAPQDVDLFVFWTRDPQHILASADQLTERGFSFYVMITLNSYPNALEPFMVSTLEVLRTMKELAQKIGPDRVIWRYDPIIVTSLTDEDFHKRNFSALARQLAGSVRRVIISIYDEYRESKKRLARMEQSGQLRLLDSGDNFAAMLSDLAKSAEAADLEIQSCAEKEDFSPLGIKPGACIDPALIEKIFSLKLDGKDKNQRPHCLCGKSVDIGVYGTCAARCVYCYASFQSASAR